MRRQNLGLPISWFRVRGVNFWVWVLARDQSRVLEKTGSKPLKRAKREFDKKGANHSKGTRAFENEEQTDRD